jgi:hypothetical protein
MSSTVKTVLIVGGAAVGVVLLMKALSPPAPVGPRPSNPGGLVGLSNLISAGSSIFAGLGASSPAPTPISYNVIQAGTGDYVVPSTANAYGAATGTGGYGIAGIDYPITGDIKGL